MMNPFEIKIIPEVLEKMVKGYIDKLIQSSTTGKTWSLDQFRKECCGGKAREWVTLYVLDEFSSEIDYHKPNGWLFRSKGRGSQNIIFAKKACEWMEENRNRIDWEARL